MGSARENHGVMQWLKLGACKGEGPCVSSRNVVACDAGSLQGGEPRRHAMSEACGAARRRVCASVLEKIGKVCEAWGPAKRRAHVSVVSAGKLGKVFLARVRRGVYWRRATASGTMRLGFAEWETTASYEVKCWQGLRSLGEAYEVKCW